MVELNIPINDNLSGVDIERIVETMGNCFEEAIDKFIPIKQLTLGKIILSQQTLMLRRKARALSKKFFKNGLSPNIDEIRKASYLTVQMYKNSLKNDINTHFVNYLVDLNNANDTFDTVKKFTKHKYKNSSVEIVYADEDKTTSIIGDEKVANALANKFEANHNLTINSNSIHENEVKNVMKTFETFVESGQTIKFSQQISPNIGTRDELDEINALLPPMQRNLLTCVHEVKKEIVRKNGKKSAGFDKMPNFILKHFDDGLILFIVIIFNHIIASGTFPQKWKHALITPIPKNGRDTSLIKNWRPISMLSSISKLFEKIIEIRLSRFLTENNLLPNSQFGFRNSMSTTQPLAILNNDIANALNDKKYVALIALDIAGAFDTVWHDGLIFKLIKMGVNLLLVKVINSYLRNRTFSVIINGVTSQTKNCNSGVPQGSVLAPKLFNCFLYDIIQNNIIKLLQFADDALLELIFSRPRWAMYRLNSYLDELHEYYSNWKLRVNDDKTECLLVTGEKPAIKRKTKEELKEFKIKIGKNIITPGKNLKYLGLTLNGKYNFIDHVKKSIKRAGMTFANLKRMIKSKFIKPKLKMLLYKQYIRPVLQYASPIWLNQTVISSAQVEKIRLFERKIIRSAANVRRERNNYKYINNTKLYEQAGIARFDVHCCKLNFSFINRCKNNPHEHIRKIAELNGACNKKYKMVSNLASLRDNDILLEDGKLLLFNKSKYDANKIVYNINQ